MSKLNETRYLVDTMYKKDFDAQLEDAENWANEEKDIKALGLDLDPHWSGNK